MRNTNRITGIGAGKQKVTGTVRYRISQDRNEMKNQELDGPVCLKIEYADVPNLHRRALGTRAIALSMRAIGSPCKAC